MKAQSVSCPFAAKLISPRIAGSSVSLHSRGTLVSGVVSLGGVTPERVFRLVLRVIGLLKAEWSPHCSDGWIDGSEDEEREEGSECLLPLLQMMIHSEAVRV
jgi:hypothetical protein